MRGALVLLFFASNVWAAPVQEPSSKEKTAKSEKYDPEQMEFLAQIKKLGQQYKLTKDPAERKRLGDKITELKHRYNALAGKKEKKKEKEEEKKPDPKAELYDALNQLYKKIRVAKTSSERNRLKADVALVMAELKRLKEEEPKEEKNPEALLAALQKKARELEAIVSNKNLSKTKRSEAKRELSDVLSRIKAIQKGQKEGGKPR